MIFDISHMNKSMNYNKKVKEKTNSNWNVVKYYTENEKPVLYSCNASHIFRITKNRFSRNPSCPICELSSSLNRTSKSYRNFLSNSKNEIEKRCIVTGDVKDLDLHHIYSMRIFPELAVDFENVVYLSRNLHKNYHEIFSAYNATGSSFLIWLQNLNPNIINETSKNELIKNIKDRMIKLEKKISENRNFEFEGECENKMIFKQTPFFKNEVIEKAIEIIESLINRPSSFVVIELNDKVTITGLSIEPYINYQNVYGNWVVYNAMSGYLPKNIYDSVMNFNKHN